MATRFNVTEPTTLLPFLFARMPERSRTTVKSLLAHRQITVDNKTITQFNHPLAVGQQVAVGQAGTPEPGQNRGLNIVHEDAHLIIVEKRAGLLSMATDAQWRGNSAYSMLSDHVKRANPNNRIFIVHRLDRDTSGLMMFAKSQAVQKALQEAWNDAVLERLYAAVVEGQMTEPEGTITSWLTENKALVMRSCPFPNDGQKATTHFRVLQSNSRFSLLEINLETGRKNQIRVHMQDLGHSVIGDPKYGSTQDPIHRLGTPCTSALIPPSRDRWRVAF